MTRKPEGEKARVLANAGVEIVRGDLDDAESLKKALAVVWGVYETGIPHFENKSRVEDTVRSLGFPSSVIIRPVFFMENLLSPWFLHDDRLVSTLDPATRLQMIAVEDVGVFGALAFTRAAELNRRELDIAGDAVTLPEAAST